MEQLERSEQQEQQIVLDRAQPVAVSPQLDVIAATTAEEREFNELRRELPLATSLANAAEVLFRRLKRIVPAANFTLFGPTTDGTEILVQATSGIGVSAIEGLRIPLGERISGWAMAHKQAVVNSNAALELGPVVRTLAVPLRYAMAVPIFGSQGAPIGVLSCFGSEPFDNDHRRILESAATLYASSATYFASKDSPIKSEADVESRSPRIH